MHICIQWRIVGNESIQRLQTFFLLMSGFFYFLHFILSLNVFASMLLGP